MNFVPSNDACPRNFAKVNLTDFWKVTSINKAFSLNVAASNDVSS
jgi:hypothetical protein